MGLLTLEGPRFKTWEVCRHDRLAILGHGRRRHGDAGNHRGRGIVADLAERRDPVDPRKLNVHQDEIGMELSGEPDALFARFRFRKPIALEGKYIGHQFPVFVVVLNEEDQLIRQRAPAA
jgi:hypothetical protein